MFNLEDYIEKLIKNQNNGATLEQMNLYTTKDYYVLLRPVLDVVQNNPDASMEELRNKLYEESHIEDKIRNFINKTKMAPGMVIRYGTKNFDETIVIGNRQEVKLDADNNLVPALEKMTEDTIFDLASVTKLYTSLSVLKLVELGLINLNDKVTNYIPQFKNLGNVTIMDLMTFNIPLRTNGRVDKAKSRKEAEQILFNIEIDESCFGSNKNPYTDMGAMILKYVIEAVTTMNFYDFINDNILKKVGLTDTHVVVPKYKLDRVASANFERKYYKDGNIIMTTDVEKGIVHDPKAKILGQPQGNLSGHSGLFSTSKDMTMLAKSMINGTVIDSKFIEMMALNKTGRKYLENGEEKYVQYLGMLCYSKNPYQPSSEIFHALSGRSLASAGYTGNQLTIDPINNLYFFMAGNRTHNRFTFIDKSKLDEVQKDANERKTIILPSGEVVVDATRFAWDRDIQIVHPVIELTLQYKMLEDIYNYQVERQDINTRSL